MKQYQFGMSIGRFQHIHRGHEVMINRGLELCEKLIVIVGSEQEFGTARNPFNATLRKSLIREIFGNRVVVASIPDYTNENDHCEEWGRFLLNHVDRIREENNIANQLDVLVFGNDEERESWFNPKDIEKLSFVRVPRVEVDISATALRGFMARNALENWKHFVNPVLWKHYDELRSILVNISDISDYRCLS